MKVLLIHNFYRSSSPSGEDTVFNNEAKLLRRHGIEVITYEKNNDDIEKAHSKIKTALNTVWSRETYKQLKSLIRKEKPDVAHVHNIWYLISPSAYYACKDSGVPVVQTLHNFRMFCANGLFMRDGRVCEECLGRLPWRSVAYGCYRDSRLYSIPVAMAEAFHKIRGTWTEKIDAYIALTEFGKQKFIECGLDGRKIFVKPNYLSNPPSPNHNPSDYAVFLGRLSPEKGINVLLAALRKIKTDSFHVKIIGDGPLREEAEANVKAQNNLRVEFTGRKSFSESMDLLSKARFLVMPSCWYEGFPMVIREAFACGKSVVASNLGAMAELVEDGKTGVLFEPGNPQDLASKIKWMIENKDACIEMGKNARAEFEAKYTADRNVEILTDIYEKVLAKGEGLKVKGKMKRLRAKG